MTTTPDAISQIPVEEPPAHILKLNAMIVGMEEEMNRRVSVHTELFNKFWHDPDTTPQEYMTALGTRAESFFGAAAANIQSMATLATFFNKSLGDFISTEAYTPPVAIDFHSDGSGFFP